MKKYTLEIIVFVCGAVVMILELVGSRILAPHLGTSLIVWTSLIGVVLGSLSLGYWWGGKVADRGPSYGKFSLIILGAALSVGIMTLLKSRVLEFLEGTVSNLYLNATCATVVLFGLPSVLLGMISPYAVKLKMRDLDHTGSTVGNLYAISTVGSIAGTFLAGFVLIARFGSTKILVFLSAVLAVTSLLASLGRIPAAKIALLAAALVGVAAVDSYTSFMEKQGIVDTDTQYNRVLIYTIIDETTGRPVRIMSTNPKEAQSAMYLDRDNDLVLEYTRFYRLAGHFRPDLKEALMIGGAGYSYPKEYLKKFPDARLDVVEIDPGLTALAKRYFNLRDDPRLTIYHEDGRTFLNTADRTYDVIFGDAFKSFYSLPYQLTTRESVEKMYDRLNDNGVVLVNMISAITGEKGRFLRAEYATFKAVFPQVFLFPLRSDDGDEVQNIILVALKSARQPSMKSDDPELQGYLQRLWKGEVPADTPLLTDEFAPVDNYMLEIAEDL